MSLDRRLYFSATLPPSVVESAMVSGCGCGSVESSSGISSKATVVGLYRCAGAKNGLSEAKTPAARGDAKLLVLIELHSDLALLSVSLSCHIPVFHYIRNASDTTIDAAAEAVGSS